MLKTSRTVTSRCTAALLLMASGLVLAGCNMNDAAIDDYAVSDAYYDRHPITVEKTPVKMAVAAKPAGLTPEQINAVAAFGRDASANAHSRVSIRYPSGARNGRRLASSVGQLLIDQGVPAAMISAQSYSGGASAPLQLTYTRKIAVTGECGEWPEDLRGSNSNLSYANFGCAVQHNTAAMVANPEDFEHPRAMTPAPASARIAALQLYFTGAAAGSSSSASGDGSGSSAGGSGSSAGSGSSGG